MSGLLAAIQFLTRLPLPSRFLAQPLVTGQSMRWFPLVGALIGCLVGLLDAALSPYLSVEVRSVLAVAALAAVTGGLHLDGLMDSCDGLLVFTSPERRLEIMSDSRVGSFAVVGLTASLLLKYAAILSFPPELRLLGLVMMGLFSRWAMVYATVSYPSARPEGLGTTYKRRAGRTELLIATALGGVILTLSPALGVALFLLAFVVATVLARYAVSKIAGLTGDVYGAISELVEIAVAVAMTPLARGFMA